MFRYIVKVRRQYFGKVYERGDVLTMTTPPAQIPEEWKEYFEPECGWAAASSAPVPPGV